MGLELDSTGGGQRLLRESQVVRVGASVCQVAHGGGREGGVQAIYFLTSWHCRWLSDGKTLGKESPHPGRALETDLGFICVTLGRSLNLPEPHFSHL